MIAAYVSIGWANLSPALGNHLWQSTWFAAIAGTLALTMRKHEARVRYALWLTASLKFLVPFSLLVSAGSLLTWPHAAPAPAVRLSTVVQQASQPFVVETDFRSAARAAAGMAMGGVPALLFAVWLAGFLAILFSWWLRWRRMSALVRASTPIHEGPEAAALLHLRARMRIRIPVALRSTATTVEPGIFGIFRPVLLLPAKITDRLAGAHLESVLAHEMCHVRRRDNLAAAVHMLVEAIFWFHPLVWWIGARLIGEREHACDEAVVKLGNDPEVYAESILQTCRYYFESPLACVSGITGSDLKMRIVRIMSKDATRKLTLARRVLLAAVGVAAISAPIIVGILRVPASRAQALPATAPKFEVISIKPSHESGGLFRIGLQPSGRFVANNITVQFLLELTYGLKDAQISGAPRWVESEHFAIEAKPEDSFIEQKLSPDERSRQTSLMMQALLADRFKLALHHETKELPVYVLVVAKGGSKLKEAPPAPPDGDMPPPGPPTGQMRRGGIRIGRGELIGSAIPVDRLEDVLSRITARPVLNRTGLQGIYDFTLKWTPEEGEGGMMGGPPGPPPPDAPPPPDPNGPPLFTAIEEQLGLKLEAQKAPMDTVVIDHVERPSEN